MSEDAIETDEALEMLKRGVRYRELGEVNALSAMFFWIAGVAVGIAPAGDEMILALKVSVSLLVAGGLASITSAYFTAESSFCFFDAACRWRALAAHFEVRPPSGRVEEGARNILREHPEATPQSVNWSVWPWKEPFLGGEK